MGARPSDIPYILTPFTMAIPYGLSQKILTHQLVTFGLAILIALERFYLPSIYFPYNY